RRSCSMADARSAPRARLRNGLTADQNLVMQELSRHGNWKRACDTTGVSYERFRHWMRKDPHFRRAFEEMNGETVESVKRQLESSAQRAAEVFDDALEAMKDAKLDIKCPACGVEIKIEAEVPDYATRLKAGETILKV